MLNGLNVDELELYSSASFTSEQMEEISLGLEAGLEYDEVEFYINAII